MLQGKGQVRAVRRSDVGPQLFTGHGHAALPACNHLRKLKTNHALGLCQPMGLRS